MANELTHTGQTSYSLKAIIRNAAGSFWNTSGTPAFETYNSANWPSYQIAMTETGVSGDYVGSMPTGISTAGIYRFLIVDVTSGTSTVLTNTVAVGVIDWSGTAENSLVTAKLAGSGLDAITLPTLSTVATTFPGMVVQLWRRFFKKAILTSGTLITYADDGTTAVTTQTSSDTSTSETQGAST